MKIKYTDHAKYQLRERKIERVWIEETIKRPDRLVKIGKKHYSIKKLDGHTLKVIYIEGEKYIKVITTYWLT